MYFISVLLNLTLAGAVPTHGWMQDNNAYETIEACQSDIPERTLPIHYFINEWSKGLGQVDAIQCLTEEEWVKLNEELGHINPKKNSNKKLNNSQT
tara:strand:- start:8075 stop:8362 length:288 start_codon:yes stop_codon:yes gene_type:complete